MKAVTPDKIPPKNPTTERKIDLTKSESAGKADYRVDEDTLLMVAKAKPASLLKKIGSWHNHLSVEIALNK
eukprot:4270355-Ditylum_brightwellii.AAC.1